MATFDWSAFFSFASTFIVVMGGGWFEIKRREAATQMSKTADLTVKTAEVTALQSGILRKIAIQTDGMSKHLAEVARREGILEGIAGAEHASSNADHDAAESAASIASQFKDMTESGDFDPRVFDNIDRELQSLMEGLAEERRRKG